MDTQQSVSASETSTWKGVSAHVAGSTTQGTYRLHPHIYVNKHRHFQSFLDLLAGQLYILIANRQLNQIAVSVHFSLPTRGVSINYCIVSK